MELEFYFKIIPAFEMFRLLLLSCVSIILTSAAIFIDRSTLDFNKEIGNLTTTYYHNEKGNSITNLTMRTFKTIHKMLAYVKVKLAEDENDRECRREFLRTIVDVEKLNKGAQANFLVKAYMENIRRFMDFDIKLPLQPVSCAFSLLLQI